MHERMVIDTGPLIALDPLAASDIPAKLNLAYLAPEAVRRELESGVSVRHPSIRPGWLEFQGRASPPSAGLRCLPERVRRYLDALGEAR